RIFSFGVGSSPNRYLLDHLAKMGRGAAGYLGIADDPEAVMRPFIERISHPAMTDISLEFKGLDLQEVYPPQIPDLYVGRPVIVTGRFKGNANGMIRIKGVIDGVLQEFQVPLKLDDSNAAAAIPTLWARAKIADLLDRTTWQANDRLPNDVRQIALEYGLL